MRFSFLFPRLRFSFIVAIVVIGGDGGGNGGSNDDKGSGSGGVDDDDDKNGSNGRVFGYVLFSNFVLNPSKLL